MADSATENRITDTEIGVPPPANAGEWLLRVFQGIIIGSGAILPGISGGILCVAFGLYQPMMSILARPAKTIRKAWKLFLPVGIGWILGFWLFAKLIELLFAKDSTAAICLFIGLIAGSFPALLREANKEGHSRGSWVSLIVSTAVMLAFFFLLNHAGEGIQLEPNLGWFFFCGILWGLSLIVPGMSSSSLEIYLGLFAPMTAGISAGDPGVLLPMLAGIAFIVLTLAKLVDFLFRKYYRFAFYAVIGFVIASTAVIIPVQYAGIGEFLIALGCAVVGFLLAFLSEKLGNKNSHT